MVKLARYAPYGLTCTRCKDTLIAPHRSQYVSECHVQHSWCCDRCCHQFETLDETIPPTSSAARFRPLPLVA
jgi:hypothetical protein